MVVTKRIESLCYTLLLCFSARSAQGQNVMELLAATAVAARWMYYVRNKLIWDQLETLTEYT